MSDEAEHRLRQDIEEAIEQAADLNDIATAWWYPGDRHIDALIDKIVVAAKEYKSQEVLLYKQAMEAMVQQFVCTRATALELAETQMKQCSLRTCVRH